MLQIHDIRQSRIYQEAKEEGKEEGLKEGTSNAIAKMAAKRMSAAEIAAILELDVEVVQRAIACHSDSGARKGSHAE
jgi:predicted transposase YdaD